MKEGKKIQKEGRNVKEGMKERSTYGRTEGRYRRTDGRKEGRTEGRKERRYRRNEGRKV